MQRFRRLGPVALGVCVTLGVACGGDSGGPTVTINALQKVSGDSQATVSGDQLANPLRVRVLGTDGLAYRNASVTWTVTGGTATLGSPTALSDTQGFATTTVTLGATPGAISISASVPGVSPVGFGATSCDHPVLAMNDTIAASLAPTDCNFSGFYTDFYDVAVPAGPQGVALQMEAGTYDTWLELYLRNGSFIGYDDDIDSTNTNSRITAILGTGNYLIAPSTYNALITGPYTIAALSAPAELAGCELVWVTRGVTISDSVTSGDCVDSTNGTYYADVVAMYLLAGTTLKVSHHSTAFDAALFLRNAAGTSVATNNDSAAATTNAYIAFPVVTTGAYLLFVGTNTQTSTGAYDLSISSSTTLNSAGRDEGRQVLRLGGLRWPKGRAARSWSRSGT